MAWTVTTVFIVSPAVSMCTVDCEMFKKEHLDFAIALFGGRFSVPGPAIRDRHAGVFCCCSFLSARAADPGSVDLPVCRDSRKKNQSVLLFFLTVTMWHL